MKTFKSNFMNGAKLVMEDLLNNDGNLKKTKCYIECINAFCDTKYCIWLHSLPTAIKYIFVPITLVLAYMRFVKYCIKVGKTL